MYRLTCLLLLAVMACGEPTGPPQREPADMAITGSVNLFSLEDGDTTANGSIFIRGNNGDEYTAGVGIFRGSSDLGSSRSISGTIGSSGTNSHSFSVSISAVSTGQTIEARLVSNVGFLDTDSETVKARAAPPAPVITTQYIYRLGTSAPSRPTSTSRTPAGWSSTSLSPTSTQNVYRSTRSVRDGVPGSWGNPSIFRAKLGPGPVAPEVSITGLSTVREGVDLNLSRELTGGTFTSSSSVWTVVSGGGDFSDSSGADAVYSQAAVDQDTAVQVRVTVTVTRNSQTRVVTATHDFTVTDTPPPNTSPQAKIANALIRVNEGDTVSLDASGSTDADGTIETYLWEQIGTPGVMPTITDADMAVASVTIPTGIDSALYSGARTLLLYFRVTVTDNHGASNAATKIIIVTQPAVPTLPVAAAPTLTINGPEEVQAGSAVDLTTTVEDGTYDTFTGAWSAASGNIVPNGLEARFTAPTDLGDVVITLVGTARGTGTIARDATQDTVTAKLTITVVAVPPVIPPDTPPVADAGQNRGVAAGVEVVLDGSGSFHVNGNIASYAWRQLVGFGDTIISLLDGNTVRARFVSPARELPQSLVFELEVTDDGGRSDTDTVTIEVAGAFVDETEPVEIVKSDTPFEATPADDEHTPTGRYVAYIRNHLVIAGNDDDPYGVWWSALGNSRDFKPAKPTQAGFKDMQSQYGRVQGLVPGKFGYVFQEHAVVMMTGSDQRIQFRFDVIDRARGAFSPESICWTGDRVFFYSEEGFYMIVPGSESLPIGAYKVNRWVYRNVLNIENMVGYVNPTGPQVFWSVQLGQCNYYDAILVYDWILEEWGLIYQEHTRLGVHHPGTDVLLPETDAGSDELWDGDEARDVEGSFGDEVYRGDVPKLYVFTEEGRRGLMGTGSKPFRAMTGFFPVRQGAPLCTVSGVRPIVDALEDCELGGERVMGKVANSLSSKARREYDFDAVVHPDDGKARMKEVGRYIRIDYRSDRMVDEISGFEVYSRQKTRFSQ